MGLSERQKKVLKLIRCFDKICTDNNIWYTLTSGSILGAVRNKGFIPWDNDLDVFIKIEDREKLRNLLNNNEEVDLRCYMWDKEKKYAACHDRFAYNNIPHEEIHVDVHSLIGAPDSNKKQKLFTFFCFYSYTILRCKHVDVQYSKPNHRRPIKIIKFFLKVVPDALIRRWYYFLENKYTFNESDYLYTVGSGYRTRECLPKGVYLNTIKVPFENLMLPIPKEYDKYLTSVYGDYMTPKKEGYKLIK